MSVQLTIYSNSGHMVRQMHPNLSLISVPKSIDVSSIVALTSQGKIIPIEYLPAKSLNESLTKSSALVSATVVKNGQSIDGTIQELDANNVTLRVDNNNGIVIIRNYDQIQVRIPTITTIRERPQLFITGVGLPVTVSYLFSDISWTCIGTVIINPTQDSMQLHLTGYINNNTGDLITADISLISGTVQQRRRQPRYFAGAVMAMAESKAPGPSQQVSIAALEEYVKYKLGNMVIENQVVIELGALVVPVVKVYQYQVGDEDVYFGYSFETPDYIPQCFINAYTTDAETGIGSFIGSSQIEEHQKGQEIDFTLGQTTKVQAQSEILPVSDIIVTQEVIGEQHLELNEEEQRLIKRPHEEQKLHLVTEELNVDISNYNETTAFFCLKHYLRGRRLINTTCRPANKQEPGLLEWFFQLQPGTKDKPNKERFNCTMTTMGYY